MTDKLSLIKNAVAEAKSSHAITDLPEVRELWVNRYQSITGKNDGLMRFEHERLLFTRAFEETPDLEKCDDFSKYTAFMDLCTSDLTLADGISYVLTMDKKKVIWMPGWKGRLEQINRLSNVKFAYVPEVVYDCDEFVMSKGMKKEIITHIEGKRTPESKIIRVYFIIDYHDVGPVVYDMTREDVEHVAFTKSPSMKKYLEDLKKPINKDRIIGDPLLISFQDRNDGNQWKTFEQTPDKMPMFLSDQQQYFKKAIIKRTYQDIPKLDKRLNEIDARISENLKQANVTEDVIEEINPSMMIDEQNSSSSEYAEYEEIGVNKSTGEVENPSLNELDGLNP